MFSLQKIAASLVIVGSLAAASCGATVATGRVYVRTGPPPVVHERVVVAPGPEYVWVPGYYRWSGREYVWVAGRYERPPRGHAHWVAGHWVHESRGWYFVEGHWR